MIKLIVTDLDGTLLNDDKQLPKNFREVLYALKERGILFAVASGRSYSGVSHIFSDMAKDIDFICDNGAFIVENQQPVEIKLMDKVIVHRVFDTVNKIGNVDVLVCGKKGTYYSYCTDDMQKLMSTFYTNTTFVEDLYSIDDDIFKLSVCDFNNPLINSFPVLEQEFKDILTVNVSGKMWVDTMNKEADKGVGVKKLQQKHNISKGETMAFGDFYNDISMLENAEFSFVMENAHEEMKKYGRYIAKDCNSEGVTQAIIDFVLNK